MPWLPAVKPPTAKQAVSKLLLNHHTARDAAAIAKVSVSYAQDLRRGLVAEGRDITTVVAPDAPVRILLTAAPDVRAARRSAEVQTQDAAAVAEALHQRDASDSTVVDFLTAAPGVTVVDSTELNFDQTVDAVLGVIDTCTTGSTHG